MSLTALERVRSAEHSTRSGNNSDVSDMVRKNLVLYGLFFKQEKGSLHMPFFLRLAQYVDPYFTLTLFPFLFT